MTGTCRPPLAWLDLLAGREISATPLAASARPQVEQLVVLSQEEFGSAVRDALRAFTQPDQLQGNLLLHSRLVAGEGLANASEKDSVQKIRDMLLQAAEALRASPRTEKFYRALEKTYFHPTPTQEIAAELLDLPFSTYRRHLKAGIDYIVETLWQKEIGHFKPN